MIEFLRELFRPDPLQGILSVLLGFVIYTVLGLIPVLGILYAIYFLLTLPLRRNERIRLFLDLLELGLKQGHTPENAILDAAGSRDRALGARFQLLAAYIEQGMRLSQALDQVPRLLTPQIRAILKTGERLGDLRKVLPGCRLALHGGVSHVRGALNYLLVLSFLATPISLVVPLILKFKILPAFEAVFAGMMKGSQLPAFTRFVFDSSNYFVAIQVAILALVWLLTIGYLGGPRLHGWFSRILPGGGRFIDTLFYWFPWRRKRLQRDFSAMLAVLLEAGVTESEAVRFAGEATANNVFRDRAERAGALLSKGIKLPEAVRALDNSGELQWRLANALRGTGGFIKALTGWHEALDAKAFQLEQTAAQVTTAFLVLLNGFIVACIVIGMFLPLIQLLNHLTLW